MTTHTHVASAAPVGSTTMCDAPGCNLPIIFDGNKWRWLYDLTPQQRRKLQNNLTKPQTCEGMSNGV